MFRNVPVGSFWRFAFAMRQIATFRDASRRLCIFGGGPTAEPWALAARRARWARSGMFRWVRFRNRRVPVAWGCMGLHGVACGCIRLHGGDRTFSVVKERSGGGDVRRASCACANAHMREGVPPRCYGPGRESVRPPYVHCQNVALTRQPSHQCTYASPPLPQENCAVCGVGRSLSNCMRNDIGSAQRGQAGTSAA
jgi:hypothetical protein